jgi:hypothetical protein
MNSGNNNSSLATRVYNSVQNATEFATSSMYIFISIAFVLLVAVIIYVVITIRRFALKDVPLTSQPVVVSNPANGGAALAPMGLLPESIAGNEFTISAWLYIDNLHDKPDDNKVIMYQGGATSFENASWLVYMDANTNKLTVALTTTGVDGTYMPISGPNSKMSLKDVDKDKFFLKASIDYVPMQKWVLVAFTVKDTNLTVYLDGELYTVSTVYDLPLRTNDIRPIVPRPKGDIVVGAPSGTIGVAGYIGRPRYSNYSMTMKQIKGVYEQGPYATSSVLRYLGIPNLAFRSPIYIETGVTTTVGDNKGTTIGPSPPRV